MNLQDSASELSITDQYTLVKMLKSSDIESVRLALFLIDKYKRPVIAINCPDPLVKQGPYPIIMVQSFYQYVRAAARFELSLPQDDWIKENKEMLERLRKY